MGPTPELVREFVDAAVAPNAEEFDRTERLPESLLKQVGSLGLWAPFLSEAVGGSGSDYVTVGRIHTEIGRGCSGLRSMLTVHGMVSWSVNRWGTDEQKDHWLPELASGATFGVFCLSEPDSSGSDSKAEGTVAEPDGDGWVLTGRKKWITGGQVADLMMVFARTGPGMSAFLVPRTAPGVEVTPVPRMMGTAASMIAEITFSGVKLGADALLGPRGWAAGTVMTGALDIGRYSVACGSLGIVQAALEASARYTAERSAGGKLLRDQPQLRAKISDMVTSRDAARLLCERAGRLKDADDPETIMATWIAKYHASTAATKAASDAVQIHGANGCSPDYPVARLYRDAKIMEIIEGSTELQQLTIADVAYREVLL
ncbi:acyl-CoA dehydrogenase family protein [Allokutzneria albata]|uniref:Acyl-CoA dehydrogenase n=1 Tax=Allokutzneria albata TaxID=211114 RepID=A0A1G9RQC4_ALLAB|nr:acyl-CoA dehydrogenase family protein [Allokutzneria albata]SDM25260.1 Acyl-CoA dehydrogenase [Allokutzneria albata]